LVRLKAKNTLGTLLGSCRASEEIVITRHGKPVARLGSELRRHRPRTGTSGSEQNPRSCIQLKAGPFNWEEFKADRDAGRARNG